MSDTQQPMAIEKIRLKPNQNLRATAMIFSRILQNKPLSVFMLGDVVSVGSRNVKWRIADRFIDSCHVHHIGVHGLLGNHDLMWGRKKGERNFQKRFPDHKKLGYLCIVDSIAIVMLNSNFKKMSAAEIIEETSWYRVSLDSLEHDDAVLSIIVACHHAPYSNSLVVGSSEKTQKYFVPPFTLTRKCSLFISGHAHAFEHFRFSGKDYLTIGGGGGLHQPLDTSAKKIPEIAFGYKPMFHYLSVQRTAGVLSITSCFLEHSFAGFERGYSFQVHLR